MLDAITWQVPLEHPAFAGHFPGTPIFPGVLLLDVVMWALAETGVTLAACEIRSAKFLSPAHPGDILTIRHERTGAGVIRFAITAGARKIATGDIVTTPSA